MEHEHKVGVFALLVVVAIGSFFATHYYDTRNKPVSKPVTQPGIEVTPLTAIKDTEGTPYATVSVEYPLFDADNIVLNNAIKIYIKNTLAEFKKNSEENWKARVATADKEQAIHEFPDENEKMEIVIKWKSAHMDTTNISILFEVYQFSGGAHGSTVLKSFNFDVKNHKLMTIADLYPGDPNYLEEVSRQAISLLGEMYMHSSTETTEEDIKRGAGEDPKNFDTFTFTEDSITLYFQQYQVGPYVLGTPSITIPKK